MTSPTRMVAQLGSNGAASYVNTIDYITISTTGNAADFGDIPTAYQDTAALSDTHGGLE